MNKKIILICVVTTIASVFLAGCTNTEQNGNDDKDSNPPPNQSETDIFIPLSNLSTTASFYSYESEGVTIRFFAVLDASGNVHAAFDACDVCYEAKKGYRQNGNVMRCINCGQEFSINSIGVDNTAGGCWPSFLPIVIDDGNVVVKIADLEEKRYMF